jgi:hypothetical protein
MNRVRYRYVVAAALAVACRGGATPPAPQENTIRELVAREARVELGAWRGAVPEMAAERVVLHRLQVDAPGVQVWEARPPMDHWHRYVVAIRGDRLWRLGGFATNDLPDFYNTTLAGGTSARRPGEAGVYLVTLVEPGGERIVYPERGSGQEPAARAWSTARPAGWPGDTTHVYADGGSFVRLTVLARQENSYDQPWVPVVYTFAFDPQGYLRAWFRREGEPLRPPAR